MGLFDFPALGRSISDIVDQARTWVRDTAINAATGKLSTDQIAAIKAQTAEDIRRASGDNLDLAGEQVAQANREIDAIVEITNAEADAANPLSTVNLGNWAGRILLVVIAGVLVFSAVTAFRVTR